MAVAYLGCRLAGNLVVVGILAVVGSQVGILAVVGNQVVVAILVVVVRNRVVGTPVDSQVVDPPDTVVVAGHNSCCLGHCQY